jgi:hypothetical protein
METPQWFEEVVRGHLHVVISAKGHLPGESIFLVTFVLVCTPHYYSLTFRFSRDTISMLGLREDLYKGVSLTFVLAD